MLIQLEIKAATSLKEGCFVYCVRRARDTSRQTFLFRRRRLVRQHFDVSREVQTPHVRSCIWPVSRGTPCLFVTLEWGEMVRVCVRVSLYCAGSTTRTLLSEHRGVTVVWHTWPELLKPAHQMAWSNPINREIPASEDSLFWDTQLIVCEYHYTLYHGEDCSGFRERTYPWVWLVYLYWNWPLSQSRAKGLAAG